jgi:tripartite-type tricarboxylate transporter receptor subunit TctC
MQLRLLTLAAVVLATMLGASPGFAQSGKFPERLIRIVVPFAPGGGVDTLARLLAEKMQADLGVSVIVENRAGASGTVGGASVQQSAPDGYTVLFSSNTQSMAKLVMANAPYDPATDFTHIARVGQAPLLVVMSPKQNEKNLAEVAAAAQKNPDKWTAGVPALGSPGHMATIQFMRLSKAQLTLTPYRGTAPALTDVSGGHIQLLTDAMIVLLPMAQDNRVKALAITSPQRSKLAPQIPTAAESGLPGLEVTAWFGMWGPKGMPTDVVQKLNAASTKAIKELADSGKLASLGIEPVSETPAAFAKFMADEVVRNAELLKSVNFKPQ